MTTTKKYSVLLEGVDANDLALGILRDLCDVVIEGGLRTARLAAEGRSYARGPTPAWLTAAADMRVTRFARGSLDLGLHAPRLCEVAPEIFAQQQLFPAGTPADATALDLFLDAARDASEGKRDSERLDAGVLDILGRTSSVFAKGGTRLTIGGEGFSPVVIVPATVEIIGRLADETPPSRFARVRGVLDTLTVSTKSLILRLEDGRQLRGFATDIAIDTLKDLHGKDVVLEGHVTFRPSGDALRIQAESAFEAKPGDLLWTQLPKGDSVVSRPRPTASPTGLDVFFGKWPGDESDDELAKAMRDAS